MLTGQSHLGISSIEVLPSSECRLCQVDSYSQPGHLGTVNSPTCIPHGSYPGSTISSPKILFTDFMLFKICNWNFFSECECYISISFSQNANVTSRCISKLKTLKLLPAIPLVNFFYLNTSASTWTQSAFKREGLTEMWWWGGKDPCQCVCMIITGDYLPEHLSVVGGRGLRNITISHLSPADHKTIIFLPGCQDSLRSFFNTIFKTDEIAVLSPTSP